MSIADYWPAYLAAVLLGFLVPEIRAITNKQGGDTLSENIRAWFHTDTPGGGWTWAATWLVLQGVLVWLLGHILRWWP